MRLRAAVAAIALLAAPANAARFLSFVESHFSIVQRGTPLVSPDDAHVYVLGGVTDDWLLAYERDGTTGALALVQALRDDTAGLDGLHSATSFVFSPDGAYLYVVGGVDGGDRRILVFSRDAGTGSLTLVSSAGHPTLDVVTLTLSPDGAHLYAAAGFGSIVTFARDAVTGALTLVDSVHESSVAKGLFVSPDGAHLYGLSAVLSTYARDPATGLLTLIEEFGFANDLRSIVGSPDGLHVYVGKTDDIDRYDRNPVTGLLTLAESMSGAPAFRIAIDAAGEYVYAASGSDVTTVYARNPGTGALTQVQTGIAAGQMSLSADGGNAYARVAAGIAVLDRDPLAGTLTDQTVVSGEAGTPLGLDRARRGAMSPDGLHLYVLGTDVSVWQRDPTSGALTFVERLEETGSGIPGLAGANGIVVTHDGAHVLIANADDDMLVVLQRHLPAGTLTLVETQEEDVGGVTGLEHAADAAVSPDGGDVYVWGLGSHTIAHFRRDAGTGALTFVEAVPLPGTAGGVPRGGPVLSPDGLRLYLPRSTTESFHFARDPVSGALTFQEESVGGDGLVPSPDGRHVYARGRFGNPGSGEVQALRQTRGFAVIERVDVPGAVSLRQDVAVDPHGAYVWSASYVGFLTEEGFVSVLARNPQRGNLRLLETVQDGADGFTDLEGALGLVASPDGRHLYVMAEEDDAVAVLSVTACGTFFPRSGARMMISRTGVDTDPTNDVLLVKGETLLRGHDFAELDPLTHGAAVRIERGDGSVVVDAALPSGAFAGTGTAGWRRSKTGTSWTFIDRTATPSGGIQKVLLKDEGKKSSQLAKVLVRGKNGSYPVAPGDGPVNVTMDLGLPGVCLATAFAAESCLFNGAATVVRCR